MSKPSAYLPTPGTLLAYADILEKPKYDDRGFPLPTGEIIAAACLAMRICARQIAAEDL